MKYRVLVADDEPLAREKLRLLLAEETDFVLVGEAGSATEALARGRELRPDLLIVDLLKEAADGLEVAAGLAAAGAAVIFTTARREHAAEAFAADAVDYVLKPYTAGRLREALGRARRRLSSKPAAAATPVRAGAREATAKSAAAAQDRPAPERLLVKSRGRYVVVQASTIEWIEAAANYVVLHCSGTNHVVRATLTETLAQLGESSFYRAGRSTAVNLYLIHEVLMGAGEDHTIVMRSGAKVRLLRSFRELQERIEHRGPAG